MPIPPPPRPMGHRARPAAAVVACWGTLGVILLVGAHWGAEGALGGAAAGTVVAALTGAATGRRELVRLLGPRTVLGAVTVLAVLAGTGTAAVAGDDGEADVVLRTPPAVAAPVSAYPQCRGLCATTPNRPLPPRLRDPGHRYHF